MLDAKLELWQLKQMQGLPTSVKIEKSLIRIREWYEHWNGKVYVSLSGGKDSTVLLHLARTIYPEIPAVFMDGLEYPEVREFVKNTPFVVWLKPKANFKQIVEEYGYPVVNKEQAKYISEVQRCGDRHCKNCTMRLRDGNKWGAGKISKRWKYLVKAPFKISARCCDIMKRQPFMKYERKTGNKPMLAMMACESRLRQTNYLRQGCNAFDSRRPMSNPLGFWTDTDIWEYIKKFKVPYSKIYDMGYSRTGCFPCAFGAHNESNPNKFQRMRKTHPKLYSYCIDELGMAAVFDYVGIDYE